MHVAFDLIDTAASDAVVRVSLKQVLPGVVQKTTQVADPGQPGHRGERLSQPLQSDFGTGVGSFQGRSCRGHVAVEVDTGAKLSGSAPFAFEDDKVASLLASCLHPLGQAGEAYLCIQRKFLRLANDLQGGKAWLSRVHSVHCRQVARGCVLLFFFDEALQDLLKPAALQVLPGRDEKKVSRCQVLRVQVKGHAAFAPPVAPFQGLLSPNGGTEDFEEEIVASKRAHPRGEKPRPVRALEDELGRCFIRADPVVEQNRIDAKTGVDLRHLRALTVGKRGVADFHDAAESLRNAVAAQQITNQAFAGNEELLGQGVPGPNPQPAFLHEALEAWAVFGVDFQVVFKRNGLRVQQVALVLRLRFQNVQQPAQKLRQQEAGLLETVQPFPVPVGVRNDVDDDLACHASFLRRASPVVKGVKRTPQR